MGKKVITAGDIQAAAVSGDKKIHFRREDCIITPGAKDKIEELGIQFTETAESSQNCNIQTKSAPISQDGEVSRQNVPKQNSTLETHDTESITEHVCNILQDKFPEISTAQLTTIIKKIVRSKFSHELSGNSFDNSSAVQTAAGVSLINGDVFLDENSGPSVPGRVLISDAIRCHDDSHLTATYIKWEKTSFSRTVETPEISILLEGELQVKTDGQSMEAKAGDILYLSKGVCVEYTTPTMVKLACISS